MRESERLNDHERFREWAAVAQGRGLTAFEWAELKRHLRSCETCRAVFATTKPTDIDASFAELLAAGWMHFARRGVGRERWAWKCAACKPQGRPTTTGRVMSPERARRG